LSALKFAGFKTITTKELYDYFYNGKPLLEKSILLTFDDAWKSNYELVDPLLQELDMQAVLFITSLHQEEDEKDAPDLMSWHQMRLLQESNHWDIQAHGGQYHNLITVDQDGNVASFASNLKWLKNEERLENINEYETRLSNDLVQTKEVLEAKFTGHKVRAFSFPFGDFGNSSTNLAPTFAAAINYKVTKPVYPLTFGEIIMQPEAYKITTTPHNIPRFLDNGSLSVVELVELMVTIYP